MLKIFKCSPGAKILDIVFTSYLQHHISFNIVFDGVTSDD